MADIIGIIVLALGAVGGFGLVILIFCYLFTDIDDLFLK